MREYGITDKVAAPLIGLLHPVSFGIATHYLLNLASVPTTGIGLFTSLAATVGLMLGGLYNGLFWEAKKQNHPHPYLLAFGIEARFLGEAIVWGGYIAATVVASIAIAEKALGLSGMSASGVAVALMFAFLAATTGAISLGKKYLIKKDSENVPAPDVGTAAELGLKDISTEIPNKSMEPLLLSGQLNVQENSTVAANNGLGETPSRDFKK